jgi:tetratricopeptide (TPR) repeat protein
MSTDRAVHNLALPPELFGRDVLRSQITHAMFEESDGPRIGVLIGPGGVGKTAIATAIGMDLLERFSIVWMVRATNGQTAYADLLALAEQFLSRDSELQTDEESLLEFLNELLTQRSDIVLILDGAPDVDAAMEYLGDHFAGRALVTTRRGGTNLAVQTFEVTMPGVSDAVALLASRLERKHAPAELAKVCDALGNFPLALIQAAVFMQETGLSPEEYLREVERYWGEVFARDPMGRSSVMQPLRLALELIFRRITGADPDAAELFNVAAMFDSQALDHDLLLAACTYGSGSRIRALAGKPAEVRKHIEQLLRYSILTERNGMLSASDLVAAAARDRLDPDEYARFAKIAISAIDRTFHVDNQKVAGWPAALARAAHAQAAGENAAGVNSLPRVTAEVLNRAGEIVFRFGRYKDACAIFSRAKAVGQRALAEENHPVYWSICNNLARAENQLRAGVASITTCVELVAQTEAAFGSDNVRLIDPVCTLAAAYALNLKLGPAFEAYSRAYNLCVHDAQADESRRGRVLNNLGHIKLLMGDVDEAANLLNSAFAILVHEEGEDHPDVACVLVNLSDLLRRKNSLTMARHQIERALRIDRAAFGPNHPDVARDLSYLAQIAVQDGATNEAERCLAQAAAIDQRTLPQTHPRRVQRLADQKKVKAIAERRVLAAR